MYFARQSMLIRSFGHRFFRRGLNCIKSVLKNLRFWQQSAQLLLLPLLAAVIVSGCGGDDAVPRSNPPAPMAAATLARTDVAQTLVQSATDATLLIAPGKPFSLRAYFAVPTGSARPARFYAVLTNTANPAGVEIDLSCPAVLPASYPATGAAFQPGATGAGAAVCTARIERDPRGEFWAAPGLKFVIKAAAATGNAAMMPVAYDVAAKVIPRKLTLPLCPRIVTDITGDGLTVESVSNRVELKNAILAFYPFADVKFCPDAFTLLPVRALNLIGQPGIPTGSQQELDAAVGLVVNAMDQYRSARKDGYAQYVHLGLMLAKDSPSANFDFRKPTHGVAFRIGSLAAAVYAPRDMAGGPHYYFQYQLTLLHELGHVLGLFHAPGCNAQGYDGAFPYSRGVLPSHAADIAARPFGSGNALRIPLRGTIGDTHGYQLYELSNRLSIGYSGIAVRNSIGTIYDASHRTVIGPGTGEIAQSKVTDTTRNDTQVYDFMNYCDSQAYNKWISDYNYFRVARYTLQRSRDDGGFDDLSGKIAF